MIAKTPVEKALNSRCSSSKDEEQSRGHWGIYDPTSPVTDELVREVQKATEIPRFTAHRLQVDFSDRPIVLLEQPGVEGMDSEWLNIESGMQQQAVHTACAALGLGTCIYNVGVNGSPRGDWHATAEMGLSMMKPSYWGELWTSKAPEGMQSGGGDLPLPEAVRDGPNAYVETIEGLAPSREGRESTLADWSQLLWAARGRTPHLYGGRRWGLTIPTWAGGQNYASVGFTFGEGTLRYVNWAGPNAAHKLERVGVAPGSFLEAEARAEIILCFHEDSGRGRWEVGYMLYNLLIQACSLGVGYRSRLLGEEERAALTPLGLGGVPAAVVSLA